jgi:8-hydroxy-5-deazaflavin:NADPH oxidoreductase
MRITILGRGTLGSIVARAASDAGHAVQTFSSTDAAADVADAAAASDLVLLAVPFEAVAELDEALVRALAGKTVVDATNPLTADYGALTIGFSDSVGEQVATLLPGAHVVKAFNAVLAPNHAEASAFAGRPFVPVAGDDEGAKATAIEFAVSLGFDAVDAGPLRNARYVEPLAELMVQLAYFQGLGGGIAVGLLRRDATPA